MNGVLTLPIALVVYQVLMRYMIQDTIPFFPSRTLEACANEILPGNAPPENFKNCLAHCACLAFQNRRVGIVFGPLDIHGTTTCGHSCTQVSVNIKISNHVPIGDYI